MRTIDYPAVIGEGLEFLEKLEKRHRSDPVLPRIQMLRLLKSKSVSSRRECSEILGFSAMQVERWWKLYKQKGLEGLITRVKVPKRTPRITSEALEALSEEARQGRIPHLKDACRYLKEQFGIEYKEPGIWRVFKRHRIKWKTGRRQHRKADKDEQEAFKKTSDKGSVRKG